MSIPCKFERSILSYDEHEIILRSHHPEIIALNLKGLVPDEVVDVNLIKGAQREAAYRAVNPMMALPALIDRSCSSRWRSSNILTRRIRTRRCCRATPGAARVCGGSHKSSPAIHIR
jgi:hypothetical protein